MVKQKAVIKVCMNGQKSRSKALKIAVGISGVESAALSGQDKNQIEVTGEGVDAVELTTLLRNKVGHAEIVSVSQVGGEKKQHDKKDQDRKGGDQPQPLPPYVWCYAGVPYTVYDVRDTRQDHDSCSIL